MTRQKSIVSALEACTDTSESEITLMYYCKHRRSQGDGFKPKLFIRFPKNSVLSSSPNSAKVTFCFNSNVNSEPNMVLHQAR